MQNKWQILIGSTITLIGLAFLIGAIFDIDVGTFCFPVGLILIGVFMLLRPRLIGPKTGTQFRLLGDVRRYGRWQVTDEEIWLGVGDVRLDLSEATIPTGEPRIQIFGFVGDVDLIVPQGIGVSISSWAFVTDGKVFGKKEESFVTPLTVESEDYETAERRVQLEREEQTKSANRELILKLLPILDDFGRALESVPQEMTDANWVKGMALIERKLTVILEEEGLKRIEAEGKEFDPWEHEAVFCERSSNYDEGKVKAVLREGYKLHDRLIRPTQVAVSNGCEPGEPIAN